MNGTSIKHYTWWYIKQLPGLKRLTTDLVQFKFLNPNSSTNSASQTPHVSKNTVTHHTTGTAEIFTHYLKASFTDIFYILQAN
jgi:hypothetical protein